MKEYFLYFYRKKQDTWFVNTASDLKPEYSNFDQVNDIDALKKAFKYIRISKNDELFIGDVKVDPNDLIS